MYHDNAITYEEYKRSILEEAEEEKKEQHQIQSSVVQENPLADTEASSEVVQEFETRRDPEEEFFMLSVLALKMTHTEEYDAEYIYEISAPKLF